MSKAARGYYQRRADILDAAMPRILDGVPFRLLPSNDRRPPEQLLAEVMRPVEPFLIAGIPEVLEARHQPQTHRQWQRIQALPVNRHVHTISKHAHKIMEPLLATIPTDGQIYLQALAKGDVVGTALDRATVAPSSPPREEDEMASAFFLT